MGFVVTEAGGAGSRVPVAAWRVASSVGTGTDGAVVSLPGYDTRGWLDAPARSTVMAALVGSGEYEDVFYSTNMRDHVDPARFAVPWWFRAEFVAAGVPAAPLRSHVRVTGVVPRAELWVNGAQVATASAAAGEDVLAGAYLVKDFEVTGMVRPGVNALALLVYPGTPLDSLSIGWVDWSQLPPDSNMGPWRDVLVVRTGDVRLGSPHVTSVLEQGPGGPARLAVSVDVHNHALSPRAAVVAGRVSGQRAILNFRRELALGPRETATVRVGGADGDLVIDEPALWWPIGEGDQAMHHLAVTATVEEVASDHVETTFGVRTVDSEVRPGGGRLFRVNGRPVQVRGAGWSPDLFLRYDRHRLAHQLALAAHLGLNAIRPEGKLENPEFYDLCDQIGIMVLPGWECCNKWEAHAGTGGAVWDEDDADIAERSVVSEAELLRNHPSVVAFLIGSDFAPPPELAARYHAALIKMGWDLPIVASATNQGTEVTGPSGMKMTGPYDWVPPVYWYSTSPELGGAIGFNSETSAGHTVPRMPSLRKMLAPHELDRLWQQPELAQYHSGPQPLWGHASVFDNLGLFARALAERYGRPRNADDFVRKAQLAAYEAARAQFEAFGARSGAEEPATGLVYWMLNSPWPSLNWQLFDYALDTPGSYWGAHKALEPVHIQYAYDSGRVQLVNRSPLDTGPLAVSARYWRADGAPVGEERYPVGPVPAGTVADVSVAVTPEGTEGLWFLELVAEADGGAGGTALPLSRNVYWLSATPDVLEPASASWYSTGVSCFADLRALDASRFARIEAAATAKQGGAELTATVTVSNTDPSGTPAVGVHVSLAREGEVEAPVFWDDNDVTVFSGQSVSLTARTATAVGAGARPLVAMVEGYNLYRPVTLPVTAA